MAKKGGVQKLQAEINSNEDLERFIERPGLLVLDVYSEWCGPCLGVVDVLRKIKMEIGGDNLNLAICCADKIDALKRFRQKSEPTWLFVVKGKAVNILFGTDVPKLTAFITNELKALDVKRPDLITYDIGELQPEEVAKKQKIDAAEAAKENKLKEEKETARRDYLNFCTDTIMDNLPDIAVTVFGPQVNRDMFKKISEPAEKLRMQCKDRRVQLITREMWDTINYSSNNPLPEDVIEELLSRELLVCFWKMPDTSFKHTQETLQAYAQELAKPTRITVEDEDGDPVEKDGPPIVSPLTIQIKTELEEGQEWDGDIIVEDDNDGAPEIVGITVDGEEGEGEGEEPERRDDSAMGMGFGMDADDGDDGEEEMVEAETEKVIKRFGVREVTFPPIWIPDNARTHAAVIYVLFRVQTNSFLPPDPTPEPPCVVMSYEIYKSKDLLDFANHHKDEVLKYGFFSTDDAHEAKYIANSLKSYHKKPHGPDDKMVLKIAKKTSHTMLAMATFGPSYVSANTEIGKKEAEMFFPEEYLTEEQEEQLRVEEEAKQPKRKSKKPDQTDPTSEPPMEQGGLPESAGPAAVAQTVTPEATQATGETSAEAPGAEAPPADAPPADAPPADAPPADAPPADAPPAEAPPADAPPAEAPPAEVPADSPPADATPAEAPPTEEAA